MDLSDLDRSHFALVQFAKDNESLFAEYADLRVQGHAPYTAFRRAFGHDFTLEQVGKFADGIECNPWFVTAFAQRLEKIAFGELWSPKIAVHEMLSLARSPFVKDNVRFAAAKELNIMVGITIVDENGKTRAGRSLDDFYDQLDAKDKSRPTETPATEQSKTNGTQE